MKKLLLLSALLIFACSSDDSSDENNSSILSAQKLIESITVNGQPVVVPYSLPITFQVAPSAATK